ncbi:hypothetical protein HD599_000423 [Conyzicola lurida]|uniref:Dual OB-containing domain-containing protein n=1 Tax=Conyzicola lurida TaxID=1172621 RepID=A0A841AED6_9MICO|nr:hypothetical protein [Conyzicola lurida]MBB5842100.1 hypothetical protein [Conyzicola lurida]
MTTTMLVLANSYKMKRRCLAGLDESNNWVRAVENPGGLGIESTRLWIGGEQVQPGDSIRLGLGLGVPLRHQSENVLLINSEISRAEPLTSVELEQRLEYIHAQLPAFAIVPRTFVDETEYDAGVVGQSLALLFTENLVMSWETNSSGVLRPRAIFMTEQGGWNLPYTGEQWAGFPDRTAGSRMQFGPCFVTISVGELMPDSTRHYILAAGVIAQ